MLPIPKDWDEFEDIVWNLYTRKWQDPHAQRNGRQGQRQNGVDIYGQPCHLNDDYAGIQCKRLTEGKLTRESVEKETAKAENFEPNLAEFTVATTDRRDAGLQREVREINSLRLKEKKFPVYLVFWEDLSNDLADPENSDLVRKFYNTWFETFGRTVISDSLHAIETQFARRTALAIKQIGIDIPGINGPLPREELQRVEDQLLENRSVVLTGDAGTGKSVIASLLVKLSIGSGLVPLLLDSRRVANIQNETQLRQHFDFNKPVLSAIERIGALKGCRFIIDQVDNIVGLPSAAILIELAGECSQLDGVEVLVVSRKRESHEQNLLDRLLSTGFVELTCHPLDESKAIEVLQCIGVLAPSQHLISLSSNFLNLYLIAKIKELEPDFDFSRLMDEVILWEQFIKVFLIREEVGQTPDTAEQVLAEAVRLATKGLNEEDRTFCLDYPITAQQQRLISGRIIECEGRMCHFYHEKLQDYLYAWDATERGLMPLQVLEEVLEFRIRNVLTWMASIYSRRGDKLHAQFIKELVNV
jgi:hypothetical protein